MAGLRITSGTLVANTVTTLTFVALYNGVEIINLGTSPIYARTDGVAPTIAGDDCECIPASSSATIAAFKGEDDQGQWPATANPGTNVQLISAAACPFTVSGTN